MSSTVSYTNYGDGRMTKAVWTGLVSTQAADPSSNVALFADRSVQMTGTFGSSIVSSVALQGSNDRGTTWASLTDPQGNAISLAAPGLRQITEAVELVRPNVLGGDSTTAVNVYLFMKKTVI